MNILEYKVYQDIAEVDKPVVGSDVYKALIYYVRSHQIPMIPLFWKYGGPSTLGSLSIMDETFILYINIVDLVEYVVSANIVTSDMSVYQDEPNRGKPNLGGHIISAMNYILDYKLKSYLLPRLTNPRLITGNL